MRCSPTWLGGKRGQSFQGIGRSVGGHTTKIHMACDALGYPLPHFVLTGGEVHDSKPAIAVISRFPARAWCADRAYVDVKIRRFIERYGADYVVSPKKNAKNPWEYDRFVYRTRHLIENCFQKLKEFRRIATRYEKRSRHFASMVSLASVMIHLF